MTARAQQRGCLVVGVTEPTSRPGRQRSLRYTPKAGRKNSSGQVRNDGRGQVESHLGRNRLTLDAPYKAMLLPVVIRIPLSTRADAWVEQFRSAQWLRGALGRCFVLPLRLGRISGSRS